MMCIPVTQPVCGENTIYRPMLQLSFKFMEIAWREKNQPSISLAVILEQHNCFNTSL